MTETCDHGILLDGACAECWEETNGRGVPPRDRVDEFDVLIERKRRRATGTTVEVWKGFDGQPGYQTVCVEHGGIVEHETRRQAIDWAPIPNEWCPGCQS